MLLLSFAGVLLVAVLLSSLAHRTILSTAALFLVAGFVLGDGVLGCLHLQAERPAGGALAELALFAVLFTDGMRVGWAELRSGLAAARAGAGLGPAPHPGDHGGVRALCGRAGLAESLLIGAILAPPTRCSPPRSSAMRRCRPGCGNCSTWSRASTTGWRCRSWCCFLAVAAGSGDLHLGELAGTRARNA